MNLDGELRNLELERTYGKRNYDWRREGGTVDELLAIVESEHNRFDAGIIIGENDQNASELYRRLGITSIHRIDHHLAHAAGAYYQSPHERSLLISYDGGGNDGTFRTFLGCREQGITPLGVNWSLNLGIPYRALAHPIADINKPDDGREMSNAGKLMGLAAFGDVRLDWVAAITQYYHTCSVGGDVPGNMYRWVLSHLPLLAAKLGVNLSRNALAGRPALELALGQPSMSSNCSFLSGCSRSSENTTFLCASAEDAR